MSKAGSQASSADVKPSPWLFSAPIDLLIGCGGWSLPLILLVSFATKQNGVLLASAFYFLTIFCNNPHYMATVYRAYHTGTDFNQYRFFTLYITVLLILTVTLVHLWPAAFPWVLTLYLIWSPWHYSGQNFGIAMLMARRSGAQPDPQSRQLLFASYGAAYAVWLVAMQSLETPDPGIIVLGLPRVLTNSLLPVLSVSYVVLASTALFRIARTAGVRAIIGPALLSLSQGLWFLGPSLLQHYRVLNLPATYFSAGILAFMHCAQYLWITTYYARRETEEGSKSGQTGRFRFAAYYLTLIVGGLALFVPGPWLASRILGHEFVESFLIFAALVNLHHFILDGAIWKLRNHRIARLLVGRNAPTAETGATTEGLPHLLRWLTGTTSAARGVRYSFAGGLLLLGLLDQAQFNLSLKEAGLDGLARAEAVNPQDARVYFHRAQLLLQQGNTNAAVVELNRAIQINPRNAASQLLLGELLFRGGDARAALAHYDRMSELFRPDLATLLNRGLLSRQLGSNSVATLRFEEALRLAPDRNQLHYLLGESLAATGQTDAAAGQFTLYIKRHEADAGSPEELPSYLDALLKLGGIHAVKGEWTEAASRWQRGADVATTFRRFAVTAVMLENLAEAQDHLGKTAEAASSRRAASQADQLARAQAAP